MSVFALVVLGGFTPVVGRPSICGIGTSRGTEGEAGLQDDSPYHDHRDQADHDARRRGDDRQDHENQRGRGEDPAKRRQLQTEPVMPARLTHRRSVQREAAPDASSCKQTLHIQTEWIPSGIAAPLVESGPRPSCHPHRAQPDYRAPARCRTIDFGAAVVARSHFPFVTARCIARDDVCAGDPGGTTHHWVSD